MKRRGFLKLLAGTIVAAPTASLIHAPQRLAHLEGAHIMTATEVLSLNAARHKLWAAEWERITAIVHGPLIERIKAEERAWSKSNA